VSDPSRPAPPSGSQPTGGPDAFVPSAAPEPSIWLTLTFGLGAVGAVLRRRRRRHAAIGGRAALQVDGL
jgi:hypothetical protein